MVPDDYTAKGGGSFRQLSTFHTHLTVPVRSYCNSLTRFQNPDFYFFFFNLLQYKLHLN